MLDSLINIIICLNHVLHSHRSHKEERSLLGNSTPTDPMKLAHTWLSKGETMLRTLTVPSLHQARPSLKHDLHPPAPKW